MLRNVKDLRGFALLATDGVIGKVDDLYLLVVRLPPRFRGPV